MTVPFVRYQCWRPERVGTVINKEALTMGLSDFLATHVPMRRIAYEHSPRQMKETSEAGLLDEFTRAADEDEHLFAVVKGIPGTGKSHLIRWLREQYRLKYPESPEVLIVRANSSLRATIQQIIDSHIFALGDLPDPLKRLRLAVEILSQDALADRLLNGLQEATNALDWDKVQQRVEGLHRRVNPKKVEPFLLDKTVRAALKRPEGPIHRITSFLAEGSETNVGIDRAPDFLATDFEFSIEFLNGLSREGYHEVKDFCDDLHSRVEVRESLARYLNFELREYAIGNATQLATGDLRTMFNELRRHLRRQGKTLALFIEDITAFTGIDEGLIEVLVTSHRGEGNNEYCRLASIVGVTDTYYAARFAPNIKERVTHSLTLNSASGDKSDLMQDPEVRAEFAARYLNAIRCSPNELTRWADRGAELDALPNRCVGCHMREPCHHAFGSVQLHDARGRGTNLEIGLYPFNGTALNGIFGSLKDNVSRTPRTLLNNVIGYVLGSHGPLVEAGKFPPRVRDLLNDIEIPAFNPPAHNRLVQEQGEADAKRLETLFLFWGDRSVFTKEVDGERSVGGLLPDVFRAFKLKAIAGVAPGAEEKEKEKKSPEPRPTPRPPVQEKEYFRQINAWANGETLFGYDKFVDWIADLFKSFVDWQAKGISPTRVKEYLTGSRFEIENQSRRVPPGRDHYTFNRVPELRYVLLALAQLNDAELELSPDQYGEHSATLSIWVRKHELDIVAFVREPTGSATLPTLLREVLLKDVVLLAALGGDLDIRAAHSSTELYLQAVASCAGTAKDSWKARVEQLRDTYPPDWITLMRRVDVQDSVHTCRAELLQLLNRPQGASTDVRFLDASAALPILADFSDGDWSLKALSAAPETTDPVWQSALRVFDTLRVGFKSAWSSAKNEIDGQRKQLDEYLGEATVQATFEAMKHAVNSLREVREVPPPLSAPFDLNLDNPYQPARLEELRAQLARHFQLKTGRERIASLSAEAAGWENELRPWLDYLALFEQTALEQNERLKRRIQTMGGRSDMTALLEGTNKVYEETLELLEPFRQEEQ